MNTSPFQSLFLKLVIFYHDTYYHLLYEFSEICSFYVCVTQMSLGRKKSWLFCLATVLRSILLTVLFQTTNFLSASTSICNVDWPDIFFTTTLRNDTTATLINNFSIVPFIHIHHNVHSSLVITTKISCFRWSNVDFYENIYTKKKQPQLKRDMEDFQKWLY